MSVCCKRERRSFSIRETSGNCTHSQLSGLVLGMLLCTYMNVYMELSYGKIKRTASVSPLFRETITRNKQVLARSRPAF